MSMFSRTSPQNDAVDVNEFIVNDSMHDAARSFDQHAYAHHEQQFIDIEGSPLDELTAPTQKRKKKPVALILIIAALVTAGLVVASGLVPTPSTTPTQPSAQANPDTKEITSPIPQASTAPEQAAQAIDGTQPNATSQSSAAPDSPQATPSNVTQSLAGPLATIQAQDPVGTTQPTVLATQPSQAPIQAPAALATPLPAAQPLPPSNIPPVLAQPQIATPIQTAPAAVATTPKDAIQSKTLEKVADSVKPAQPSKVITQQQVPSKSEETAKQKPAITKDSTTPQPKVLPAKQVQADSQPTSNHESSTQSESVKKLITTTPSRYGLRSIQPEGLMFEAKGTNDKPLTALIGDVLPNGERLLRVDAKSNTIITDRSVVRFQ